MSAPQLFTDADRRLIEEAVREAESRTSGEIVPVVVQRSGTYPSVPWKAAMIGILPGLLLHEWLVLSGAGWGPDPWLQQLLPLTILAGALLGVGLVRWIPAVERMFISEREMVEMVHVRARQAFLDNEVFLTRERTGILLLVSLFEHRVEVLGDSGITDRVAEDAWGDVVADIITGIKRGEATQGMVAAIGRCGRLLESAGVARRADDDNELDDTLRLG
jgi:putative membrane protein